MALVPEFSEKTADIAKLLAHADDEQRKITAPVSDSKAAVNALVAMHLATATHVRGLLLAQLDRDEARGDQAAADRVMEQVRALNADVDAIASNNREQMVAALDHWIAAADR